MEKRIPKDEARERAAGRSPSVLRAWVAAGLASAALLLPLSGCRERTEPPAARPATAVATPLERLDTLTSRVEVGESFATVVQSLGLDDEESASLLSCIKENYRFKIFPEQTYRVVFRVGDRGTTLHSFSLDDRYSDFRHVLERDESAGEGAGAVLGYSLVPIPVRTDTALVNGELTTNLYDAFLAKGETPALIQMVTKIFAWDVDFFKDPRVGDRFNLLVEKRWNEDGSFRGYGQVLSAKYVNSRHDFYGILYKGGYFDQGGRSLEKLLLKAPLNFARVSSGFNLKRLHPVLGVHRPHWGIDYCAPIGTKILAAGDGVVEYAKWVNGYGKTIKIRHNSVFSTYYAHLNGYAAGMGPGRRVSQRDVIGFLGNTGLSTGPHLDYRVERNGKYINPASLKTEAKQGVATAEWKDFCDRRDFLLARMSSQDSTRLASSAKSGDRLERNL
ncbi:MAG TPA: peptidoglycan DD-metalloendopeptidase family protein [Fibrobacteria bacterium]|nr:peptidoglycan DD-metalloendopeptidase family protein [Fibrobacteria bacterium]